MQNKRHTICYFFAVDEAVGLLVGLTLPGVAGALVFEAPSTPVVFLAESELPSVSGCSMGSGGGVQGPVVGNGGKFSSFLMVLKRTAGGRGRIPGTIGI